MNSIRDCRKSVQSDYIMSIIMNLCKDQSCLTVHGFRRILLAFKIGFSSARPPADVVYCDIKSTIWNSEGINAEIYYAEPYENWRGL